MTEDRDLNRRKAIRADLWLLFLTLIWGSSFPLVKSALGDISPFLFLALRFWLASLVLGLVFHREFKTGDRKTLIDGALLGVVLWLGFAFQTVGLKFTTASKSGFLTGTLVVIVPLIVTVLERRLPRRTAVVGVALAFSGIYLMTGPGGGSANVGDLLTILCAVSFAFQVVMLQHYTQRHSFRLIGFYQILTSAVLSLPASLWLEQAWLRSTAGLWLAVAATALLATALALMVQAGKQRDTSAVNAAIIYTGEPVFAAIFSFAFLGEMFTRSGFIGAGLIIGGMVIAEINRNADRNLL